MKIIFKNGFYTLDFGMYETHFFSAGNAIAYLAGIDLKTQQN